MKIIWIKICFLFLVSAITFCYILSSAFLKNNNNVLVLDRKSSIANSVLMKRETNFPDTQFSLIIEKLKNYTHEIEEEVEETDSKEEQNFQQQCKPQQNIAFVKTHKTGSSTVTNILNRFADLRELNVVLPGSGNVRFLWPRKFHWTSVDLLRLDGQPGNVLMNHARYNREQMDMVMEDETHYITILRHPVTQFESSFYYFEFDRILRLRNTSDPIKTFMTYPDEYLYNITLVLNDLPETANLIQSGMLYDLGYDFLDIEEDEIIGESIKALEKEFKLVLIMEYFDESLVLLMLELCWQFDDILYIKQNQRAKKRTTLDDDVRRRITEWNHADNMLYQHFNRTLWSKIHSYGDRFWAEVKEFKRLNKDFEKACSPLQVKTKGFKQNITVTKYVMNPKAGRPDRYLCGKALKTEVEYLKYFRKKLGKYYGYQRLLVKEGLKPFGRNDTLHERMAVKMKFMAAQAKDKQLTKERNKVS